MPERERDAEDGLDQRAELVRLRPVDFEAYLAGREPGELTFEMFELMADLKERP